jgi:hypothetical protein
LIDAATVTLALVLPVAELGATAAASTTALTPAATMNRRDPGQRLGEMLVLILRILSLGRSRQCMVVK